MLIDDSNKIYVSASMACANEDTGCARRTNVEIPLPTRLGIDHIPYDKGFFNISIPKGWANLGFAVAPSAGLYCDLCKDDPYRFEEVDESSSR